MDVPWGECVGNHFQGGLVNASILKKRSFCFSALSRNKGCLKTSEAYFDRTKAEVWSNIVVIVMAFM